MVRKTEKSRKQMKIQFVGIFEKRVTRALLGVILYLQPLLLRKLPNKYSKMWNANTYFISNLRYRRNYHELKANIFIHNNIWEALKLYIARLNNKRSSRDYSLHLISQTKGKATPTGVIKQEIVTTGFLHGFVFSKTRSWSLHLT